MSDIIQLLERLASDASLQTKQQKLQAIAQAELVAEQQQALINGDAIELKKQLDVVPDIKCVFFPAKDDEEENAENEQEDENDDSAVSKRVANF